MIGKPGRDRSYDDTEPTASETISVPRGPKSNPNGVPPDEGRLVGACASPSPSTGKTAIALAAFSVTTRERPSGLNDTWAGPAPGTGWVEPASGVRSPCEPIVK